MVGVVQWQSTGLWFRALWVRVPSPTPEKNEGIGLAPIPFVHSIGASPSGKARDFDSLTRWFESSRPSHFTTLANTICIHDPIAQSAEQLPFKQWVRGSNPRRVTKKTTCFGMSSFFILVKRKRSFVELTLSACYHMSKLGISAHRRNKYGISFDRHRELGPKRVL